MKIMVKIVIFGILLNLSILMLQAIFPQFNNISEYRGGFDAQNNYNEGILVFNTSVQSIAQVEKPSAFLNSIFDIVGMGFLNQLLDFVSKYFYGFINMLYQIFAPFLGKSLADTIFLTLFTIQTLLNIAFSLYLFTGKDLFNNWFGN